ncbi:23S rRNA (adenine(1618)-N(6))-methyltransferase RlmF [Rheinheimera sp. 1928-s]|uniref:23S rRNA (adenine(1618)-N(6))-methyltransferase RlmF n=1 Tax=Rheinheimera sp. 1928-s TaxID=3033803 RepID=UPI00260B2045|nr:23S rRNA (adenine(1618)-N(6))-methyltransferase RlmF [Rheinheimera sp. 1928-s]MDF3124975.1 23S rRNA (adenine(1618)-N(6))-methyltransferase RlmF [Rheinheimera sp. 1928-s]
MTLTSKGLHPRNKHQQAYDFAALTAAVPALTTFVRDNGHGTLSIDFANPQAVKTLNQALLKHFYAVQHWQLPEQFLCPAVPGRVDYLHYLADLLAPLNKGKVPTGSKLHLLDIGCGANLIYPLLAQTEYGWKVTASELDPQALAAAELLIKQNQLHHKITLRQQHKTEQIFQGIIQPDDLFDLTLCNPPFHSSAEQAQAGSERKAKNLGQKNTRLNFAGRSHELWCEGGEAAFIRRMINESQSYAQQVVWFSSLVSKQENVPLLQQQLTKLGAQQHLIEMQQGNKQSRILAWSFMNPTQRQLWADYRWR